LGVNVSVNMKRRKWISVFVGAVIGGLLPVFVICLLEVTDENVLAIFIYAIYLFLSYPIVIFAAGQGMGTLIWEVLYWLFLGALASRLFFAMRTRRQSRTT
jgi:hypothetical protein